MSNMVACLARVPGKELEALILVMGGRKRWPKVMSLRREFEETFAFIVSHTNAVPLFLARMHEKENEPSDEQPSPQSPAQEHPSHRRCSIM